MNAALLSTLRDRSEHTPNPSSVSASRLGRAMLGYHRVQACETFLTMELRFLV